MWVNEPALEKNREFQFKTIGEIAKMTDKRVIDAFLDLVVEENLDTGSCKPKTTSTMRR